MTIFLWLPFVAGLFSLVLAGASLVRRSPTPATWCFAAGMTALAVDSFLTGLSLASTQLPAVIFWLSAASIVKCFIPVIWLGFALTYSRSGYRDFLKRWRVALFLVGIIPISVWLFFNDQLFQVVADPDVPNQWRLRAGPMMNLLNGSLLVSLVLILMNLEQTFRAAVGTMRWRIKYVVLALVMIFGARLYVRGQAILFSAPDITLWAVESGALLIGCLFLVLAYSRTGLNEIDVQPSSAVLRSSLTVVVVGAYLSAVGLLAVLVKRFGGAEFFQLQAFVVMLGMAGLALLVLSDRARQTINRFAVTHFAKAQHDSVRVWTSLSRSLAKVTTEADLSAVSARLISETFDALSVTVWLLEEQTGQFVIADSTNRKRATADHATDGKPLSAEVAAGLRERTSPFDLEVINEGWADELRRSNPTVFPAGGNRLCVPLHAPPQTLGAVILSDRINGAIYTAEELGLLKCIADQITSVLLNLRLAGEVTRARELDAFRTMSAFFVHDLKNAAASLNLMLKNLPIHFDDPAFRQDALRGIGNTAQRIDDMIARLSELRQRSDSVRIDTDINDLVNTSLAQVTAVPGIDLVSTLQPVPAIRADRDQLQSVITNFILNARDAVGSSGRIEVRTEHRASRVVLSVADNGCGMSAAFVRDSLFRPFQSTKRKGLGLGLFQSRSIIAAHGGSVQVESEIGKGTVIHASFPVSATQ